MQGKTRKIVSELVDILKITYDRIADYTVVKFKRKLDYRRDCDNTEKPKSFEDAAARVDHRGQRFDSH